jgi:DNA-binding GntR family transcriptional regulator
VSRIAKTSRLVAVSRSNSAAGRGGDGTISGGPRFHVPAETAFCWTEVYLDGRLAPIVRSIDVLRTAVFVMVEDQASEHIVEIKHDIHPCVIDAAKAPTLGSNVGDLALQITRRYGGAGGHLLLLSHTLLPGDRFSYSMTFHPD